MPSGAAFVFPTAPGVVATYDGPTVVSGTTYYYWVQAIYPCGRSNWASSNSLSLPSLSYPNAFVIVNWTPMAGAIGYDILKTTSSSAPTGVATNCLASNFTASEIADVGQALTSYTVWSSSLPAPMGYFAATDTATISAAHLVNMLINGIPTAAANYTTDTATAIIAALSGAVIGTTFFLTITNNSLGANTITLVAGADVTLVGTATIAQAATHYWVGFVTSITGHTVKLVLIA